MTKQSILPVFLKIVAKGFKKFRIDIAVDLNDSYIALLNVARCVRVVNGPTRSGPNPKII